MWITLLGMLALCGGRCFTMEVVYLEIEPIETNNLVKRSANPQAQSYRPPPSYSPNQQYLQEVDLERQGTISSPVQQPAIAQTNVPPAYFQLLQALLTERQKQGTQPSQGLSQEEVAYASQYLATRSGQPAPDDASRYVSAAPRQQVLQPVEPNYLQEVPVAIPQRKVEPIIVLVKNRRRLRPKAQPVYQDTSAGFPEQLSPIDPQVSGQTPPGVPQQHSLNPSHALSAHNARLQEILSDVPSPNPTTGASSGNPSLLYLSSFQGPDQPSQAEAQAQFSQQFAQQFPQYASQASQQARLSHVQPEEQQHPSSIPGVATVVPSARQAGPHLISIPLTQDQLHPYQQSQVPPPRQVVASPLQVNPAAYDYQLPERQQEPTGRQYPTETLPDPSTYIRVPTSQKSSQAQDADAALISTLLSQGRGLFSRPSPTIPLTSTRPVQSNTGRKTVSIVPQEPLDTRTRQEQYASGSKPQYLTSDDLAALIQAGYKVASVSKPVVTTQAPGPASVDEHYYLQTTKKQRSYATPPPKINQASYQQQSETYEPAVINENSQAQNPSSEVHTTANQEQAYHEPKSQVPVESPLGFSEAAQRLFARQGFRQLVRVPSQGLGASVSYLVPVDGRGQQYHQG